MQRFRWVLTLVCALFCSARDTVSQYVRRYQARHGQPMWITRDGRVLRLSEMDPSHLRNTMRLLNRRIDDACRVSRYTKSDTIKRACISIANDASTWLCRIDAEIARRDSAKVYK